MSSSSPLTKLIFKDAYSIITTTPIPWPVRFNKSLKLKLIDSVIEYYEELEEYDKCKKLFLVKEKMNKDGNLQSETGSFR